VNSSATATTARAVAIALIIAVAAVAGLAVGNAIQGRLGISAESGFSLDALQDLQQLRGDNAPAAAAIDDSSDYGIRHAVRTPTYVDYGVRHAAAQRQDYIDYGVRHATAPAAVTFTDTFRLTGPSRVGGETKAQTFTDTFRLTGPSQLADDDEPTIFGPPGR
jgi:type II secretory pathway pseudopilin PulG